jgi:type VI protein secretion system component VasA
LPANIRKSRRLLLDEEKIEDPHVERMIEAFAFLSVRVS